mmetsp:Transcript_12975/g.12852  ORF Transcript_12975/g.12852 Transcript_12975/m.12852 type:complete len:81 (-) Transcript_12975:133-375(-)
MIQEKIDLNVVFNVNPDFKNKLKRMNINMVSKPEEKKKEELIQTNNKVAEDRKFQIEAMIVRIMKEKKELKHVDLMNDLY